MSTEPKITLYIIALILSFSTMVYLQEVNRWSLQYLSTIQRSSSNLVSPRLPPPDHPHAVEWLIREALQKDDLEQANLLLPEINDSSITSQSILAQIDFQQGRYDQAINHWQQIGDSRALDAAVDYALLIGDEGLAEKGLRALSVSDPSQGGWELANFLVEQGRSTEAAEILYEGLLTSQNPQFRGMRIVFLGDLLIAESNLAKAEEIFNVLTRDDSSEERLYLQHARVIYAISQDESKARDVYQELISKFTMSPNAYYQYAVFLWQIGNSEEAVPIIERSLALDDQRASSWVQAGRIYQAVGDRAAAIEAYQEVLARNPNHRFAQQQISTLGAGPN